MNSDFKELLVTLSREEVSYLVVGGYAVIHYSQPRYTKDLDIWLEPSPENARKVMKAFSEFGISTFGLSEADFQTEGTQLNIGVPPVAMDFLTSIPGLDFQEAWKNRETSPSAECEINYLSKSDLVKAKKQAGRLVDLADIEELSKVERSDDD